MKTNELRLGNLLRSVKPAHESKILKVTEISGDAISFEMTDELDSKMDYLWQLVEVVIPIPLTPDVLEKCGFEKWPDSSTYQFDLPDQESIQLTGVNVFLAGNEACITGHGVNIKLEYLHQFKYPNQITFAVNFEDPI